MMRPIDSPRGRPAVALIILLAFAHLIAGTPSAFAQSEARAEANRVPAPEVRTEAESPLDLAMYDALLERYTRTTQDLVGTRVDYRGLLEDPTWPRLVEQLQNARPAQLDRKSQLAFWINAYNILTIDLVMKHYPVDSIRDIGSFLFPVWGRKVASIEGRSLSLGEIEHEILRPMGDPRIHAAIVCASTSCPPLARNAYRTQRVDAQLDAAMRRWLASPDKGVSIDRERRRIRLSAIFDWFEEDFETTGGVLETVARFVDSETATWLRGPGREADLAYLEYDWGLNDLNR